MKIRRGLILLTILLLLCLASVPARASMSDSAAMTQAQSIWGPHASIIKFRSYGDANWTMQVGCFDPVSSAFQPVGQGLNTWDAAFGTVDLLSNGPRTDAGGVVSYLCTPPPVAISLPATLPGGQAGVPLNQPLTAIGGTPPYTWSVLNLQNAGFGPSPLPPGLALQGNALVGTPTSAGAFNFTLFVSDAYYHNAQLPVTITIVAPSGGDEE